MTEQMLISVLLGFITALLTVLLGLLKWLGNKVYEKLSEMTIAMAALSRDLREEIFQLDRRISRVETRCEDKHPLERKDDK